LDDGFHVGNAHDCGPILLIANWNLSRSLVNIGDTPTSSPTWPRYSAGPSFWEHDAREVERPRGRLAAIALPYPHHSIATGCRSESTDVVKELVLLDASEEAPRPTRSPSLLPASSGRWLTDPRYVDSGSRCSSALQTTSSGRPHTQLLRLNCLSAKNLPSGRNCKIEKCCWPDKTRLAAGRRFPGTEPFP
jgi:hypothetical protein